MLAQPITNGRTLPALAVACTLAAFTVQPAAAQTAGNLKCNGCVNSKDIQNNGIKSADIRDGQVKNPDLANNAVTNGKIAGGAVTGDKIADGAVGTSELASEVVTGDKIATDAVAGAKVQNGSLLAVDLADEGGADFNGGSGTAALSSVDAIIRSVSITAPRAGVVIVNASANVLFLAGHGHARCSITTGSKVLFTDLIAASGEGAQADTATLAGTRGFSVNPGTTTFNLVCDKYSGDSVTLLDNHITAMFFPTKY